MLLVAAALAISAGWASFVPFRALAHRAPAHTIGSHFAHVPQALTPRSPADERKDLRHGPQPAVLADTLPAGAQPVAIAAAASVAGVPVLVATGPQPRAPPAVLHA